MNLDHVWTINEEDTIKIVQKFIYLGNKINITNGIYDSTSPDKT